MAEELTVIVSATESAGRTPGQTLSRILQEIRDEGTIEFLGRGHYVLLDTPFDAESEDLTDEAIDIALRANKLRIGRVETGDVECAVRRRRGQERLRQLVLRAYRSQCAVCDVADSRLLIASHILGWAEAPDDRGDLTNVMSLCRFHDTLFEHGYWSLRDDLTVVKRATSPSRTIRMLLDNMTTFTAPAEFQPAARFLQIHRSRFELT
ncbi:MAG: HNH endonuclease [Planctomycetes bacterium]|nr:HNH endonuclease [Planctomycetota bacterium]